MIINLKGNEGSLSSANTGNTFFNSVCVRLVVTANAVIEVYDSANNLIGDTTLLATNEYFVQKATTDQIRIASGSALATPVAFTIS